MSQDKRPSKKTSHGLAGLREFPTINPNVSKGFAKGQKVFQNRFTLRKEIGRGAMGVVWLARDEVLGEDFALKFLPELVVSDMVALRELLNETRRCMALTHHHIVKVYDLLSEQEADLAAIKMEYVDGPTLSARRIEQPGEVFSAPTLEPFLCHLCEALDYAHNKAGIVHRDLKPSNLLTNSRGELKLADFGVARNLADAMTRLTRGPMSASGTLPYMSLQQLMGKRPTALDDVYGLGATIFELLTSTPPYYSGDISLQIQHVSVCSVAERRAEFGIEAEPIPPRWEEVIAACLNKDPAKRPQGAKEVFRQLTDKTPAVVAPRPELAVAELERAAREAETVAQVVELEQRIASAKNGPLAGRAELIALADTAIGTAKTRARFLEPFPQRVEQARTHEHIEALERELDLEAGRFTLRPETQARLKSLLLDAQTRVLVAEDLLRNAAKPRLAQARTPEDLRALRSLLDEPDHKVLLEGNLSLAAELNGLLKEAEQRVQATGNLATQFEQDTVTAETPEQVHALEQRLAALGTGELAARPDLQEQLAAALAAARERVEFASQFNRWVDSAQTRQQVVELDRALNDETERLHLRPEWLARLKERWQTAELRVTVAENELCGRMQLRSAEARTPEDFHTLRMLLEEPAHQALAGGNPALAAELHRFIEEAELREADVQKFAANFERDAAAAEAEARANELAQRLEEERTETLAGRTELQDRLAAVLDHTRERIALLRQLDSAAEQAVNRRQVEDVGRQLEAGVDRLGVRSETRARWQAWMQESLARITAAEESVADSARQRFAQAQNDGEVSAVRAWLAKPDHQALLEGNPKLGGELAGLAREADLRIKAATDFATQFERDAAAVESAVKFKELDQQLTKARTNVLAGQTDRAKALARALELARSRADFAEQFPRRTDAAFTRREAEELGRELEREGAQLGLSLGTRTRFAELVKAAHQRAFDAEAAVERPRTLRVWAAVAATCVIVIGALIYHFKDPVEVVLPPPPPDRGTLLLVSEPLGATVRQVRLVPGAGELVAEGKTPATFTNLLPGAYAFEFTLPGYETVTNELAIQAGHMVTTNFTLVRQTGFVELQTVPAGVDYFIRQPGLELTNGRTPASVPLFVGEYQVTFQRPNHPPFSTNVTVTHRQRVPVRTTFSEGQMAFAGQAIGAQYEILALDAKLSPLTGKATASPLTGMPAGRYRVVLRNEGFVDIVHTNIIVRDGLVASLPPPVWKAAVTTAATPPTGGFMLTTVPPGAAVEATVEDAIVKKTAPATFSGLKPGSYEVTLLLAAYDRLTTNVTVKAGSTNTLTVSLRRTPIPPGQITFTSKPDNAEFRVLDAKGNELDKGRTGGAARPLPPGEYQVVLKQTWAGALSATVTKPVKVASAGTVTVDHVFDEGTVRVTSTPPGAQIKLGGTNLLGRTDAAQPLDLKLPAGQHKFVASLGGLPAKSADLALKAGGGQALRFEFSGRAFISSNPAGAEVWIDGQRQPGGMAEGYELLEGTHEIELRMTGHAPLKTSVEIVAGLVNRSLENRRLTPLVQGPAVSASRWTNGLAMSFARVPVARGNVLFSIYETRVQDFRAFAMEKGLSWQPEDSPPAGPQADTHPAVNISWQMATDFCAWLTERERAASRLASSQRYRLPTDLEWSAAVGLKTETGATPAERGTNAYKGIQVSMVRSDEYPTPWGQWPGDKPPAPGAGNYAPATGADAFAGTAAVGSFKPNQFGLHDLGGNAWEWCEDRLSVDSLGHVLRGGSWRSELDRSKKPPIYLFLSGTRFHGVTPLNDTGFRVVLDLGQ